MKLCRYCNQRSDFIKAHAIPEAFFADLREDKKAPLLVAGRKGEFPKKAWVGIYDEHTLCSGCEKKFQSIDTYGIDVLLRRFDENFSHFADGAGISFSSSEAVDTSRVLRFLLAILWRASVSEHKFYAKVSLGPYEEIILGILNQPDLAIPPVFDAIISKWKDQETPLPAQAMLNPYREHWDGVAAYRLYLGQLVAYIKVDKQPFSNPFSSCSLQTGSPCRIVHRVFSTSKDFSAIRKTVAVSEINRLSFQKNKRDSAL